MAEKLFHRFVRYWYVLGIAMMIASLPHSKYFLSVSGFILAEAFALERMDLKKLGRFLAGKTRLLKILLILPFLICLILESIVKGFRVFFRNKPAMVFMSLFLLHLAGLLFTTDFDYAFKDLRTKVPLFLLPLFIATSESFGKKQFYWLLLLFAASVAARTMINTWNLVHFNYVDIRDISHPVSHIILALLIVFVLFILGYFILREKTYGWKLKAIFCVGFLWLAVYIGLSKSATGIMVGGFTLVIFLIVLIFLGNNVKLKTTLGLLLFLCLTGVSFFLYGVIRDYYHVKPVDLKKLEEFSPRGNRYTNFLQNRQTENGNLIWIYVQWDELRESWNKRSSIPYDSLDNKKQQLKFTLIRYLTSLGYRKDADGVSKLTEEDIRAIENGNANYLYAKNISIRGEIYQFLFGFDHYRETGDPTGSSVMQRLEFWKASVNLIRENWLTGVGTGDMNIAFADEYNRMHSKLPPDQRWRSHNQFLSVFVGFGIIGFAWFLFSFLYPPIVLGRFRDYYFLIFFIIAMLSMIPEDTIESQSGVTFYAFFYCLLLFGRKESEPVP
jgi:hypothetical protein